MVAQPISPGLAAVELAMGESRLCLYLLYGERALLVDSGLRGMPGALIFPALEAAGLPTRIDLLLNSHADADHHGGNAEVLDRCPQALVLCHALDAPRISSRERHLRERYTAAVAPDDTPYEPALLAWLADGIGPDAPVHIALSGDETIWLGPGRSWRVIHAPGHTDGHLALWDAAEGALIIQDAALGRGVPDAAGRIASPPPYFAVAPYLAALGRLRGLGAGRLLSAHFPPVIGAAAVAAFLAESAAFVEELDALTLAVVRAAGGPLTLSAVCAAVDRRLGPYPGAVQWVPPVRAHLEHHTAQGRLRELRGAGPRRWEI